MKASGGPQYLTVRLQRYFSPTDTGFNATPVPVAPGVTGLPMLVEGFTTFTIQFSAAQNGSVNVLTVDPEDDTSNLAQQLVANYVGAAQPQAVTFGGATTVLPGQVWRFFKLVFIASTTTGNVTARLFAGS